MGVCHCIYVFLFYLVMVIFSVQKGKHDVARGQKTGVKALLFIVSIIETTRKIRITER